MVRVPIAGRVRWLGCTTPKVNQRARPSLTLNHGRADVAASKVRGGCIFWASSAGSPARHLAEQLVRAMRRRAVTRCARLRNDSAPMRQIVELARRVAKVDSTVLITGESGAGKERIARLVHDECSRRSRLQANGGNQTHTAEQLQIGSAKSQPRPTRLLATASSWRRHESRRAERSTASRGRTS
jgi:Sigma-54 interaction domain